MYTTSEIDRLIKFELLIGEDFGVKEKVQIRDCTSNDIEALLEDIVSFKGQVRLERANPSLFRCAEKPLNLDITRTKFLYINCIPCEGSACAPQSAIETLSQ